MLVIPTTLSKYFEVFSDPKFIYSDKGFLMVNQSQAKTISAIIGYDDDGMTPRLGLVMGLVSDGEWRCPFSAPFGEISYNKVQDLENIHDFINDLDHLIGNNSFRLTLPPTFYDPEMLTRLQGVLANYADKVYWDYNYHYPLQQVVNYEKYANRAACKNLRRALSSGFAFEKTEDIARAYAVIKANRESHNYPLAMSLERVLATVQPMGPVEADFFLLTQSVDDVAAAMVYYITPEIVQVVYWGDKPGYSHLRPMNLFPKLVFEYYYDKGIKIVDIGPSSSHGIPSPGLCRFKESLGCHLTLKPTFSITRK